MSVVENIQNVRAKIAAAAEKSGRTAEDVLPVWQSARQSLWS